MLVESDVLERLRRGAIRISFCYVHDDKGSLTYLGEERVDPARPDAPAFKEFKRAFFGDRFRVTLGPVVKSHTHPTHIGRVQFGPFPGCIDLRMTGNSIDILPRESISIASNERIALDGRHGAYILPRLTIADAGLLYIPSYIDPYWDGILQGVVVNLTDSMQRLHIGEPLAICRFYELATTADVSLRDAFPAKSHHFGNNWQRILNEEGDPFPAKKHPVPSLPDTRFQRLVKGAHRFKRLFVGLGATGTVVAVVFAAGRIYKEYERFGEVSTKVTTLEQTLTELRQHEVPAVKESVSSLGARLPLAGVVSVAVPAGQATATQRITLRRKQNASKTVLLDHTALPPWVKNIQAIIERGTSDDEVVLAITVSTAAGQTDRNASVTWVLLE